MSLKELCVKNLVEMVKNLPPLLKEEILEETLKSIKEDLKAQIMKDLNKYAVAVTEDITSNIIGTRKFGGNWKRSSWTSKMDDDLYHTCVNIAENFVDQYPELVDDNTNGRNVGFLGDVVDY
jgi:hypothetical protein